MVNSIKNLYFYSLSKICYHLERAFKNILKGLSETYLNLHSSYSIVKIQNIFISSNNFNEKMQYNDTVCDLEKSFYNCIVTLL